MHGIKYKLKRFFLKLLLRFYKKSEIVESLLNSSEQLALKLQGTGYLYDKGWWKSYENNMPLDYKGAPIPWVAYSFIDFIEPRLTKKMSIFEYGSGNSTIYYSSRVKNVFSVEHDQKFYKKLEENLPSNVDLSFCKLEYGGEYSKWVQRTENEYDLIIVDGRDRVNCILVSVGKLKAGGVIILDDAERESYSEGVNALLEDNFKRIDFWGISPGFISYNKSTTVFYKEENVLGI